MDVVEINDMEALQPLRPVWRQLWERTPEASFFQSLEWLEAAWDYTHIHQTLRVLVMGGIRNPVGILPLVVRRETRRLGSVRVLTYPLDDWGSYYGPIGAQPAKTLRKGLAHIHATRRDWDVLDLRWTAADKQDPAATSHALSELGVHARCRQRAVTSLIDMSGTWEEYLAARSGKWRNNYRRWQRRLHEVGEVRYERYRPAGDAHGDTAPRWDLYDTCERLASTSWQGSSTTGNTLSHPSVRSLLRAAHQAAVRLGCVDMNLLYIDEQPIAFAYNYHCRGRVFGLRVGFDPNMGRVSPGNMIYTHAIEDSFRRGDKLYELGPGSLECKRHLQTHTEPVVQYTHYPRFALRPQLLRLKAALSEWWAENDEGTILAPRKATRPCAS